MIEVAGYNGLTAYDFTRYKFSNDVMELMQDFSKVHQNDSKDNFDDNWTLFLEKNKQVIETEERRLKECGYDASLEDKMYKSIKYYYNKSRKMQVPRQTLLQYLPYLLPSILPPVGCAF